jgi:hypothetical protein
MWLAMLNMTSEVTSMTTEPPQLGPLSAMVKELLDTDGMSLRILAARTYDEKSGEEVLNKDFWSRMSRGAQTKVTALQLRWMATAMRRPLDVIRAAAAAEYFEFEPVHLSGYDEDTRRIIIQTIAMDPNERRRLRVWLETPAEDGSPN